MNELPAPRTSGVMATQKLVSRRGLFRKGKMKYNPDIERALRAFRNDEDTKHIDLRRVRGSIKNVPDKDIALAISFYIFAQCESTDDYTAQGSCFGGYNRVLMGNDGWYAHTSHCTDGFLDNLREHCPWVELI